MTEPRPFAITLDVATSRANKTGSWRTDRPEYVHRVAPCGSSCPAAEDVQRWLFEAESGGSAYEQAWRSIMDVNPFPAVMGRICYHPCESACNRAQLDDAVGINSVERFLGDEALRQGWTVEQIRAPSDRRVLVVGAGPSGLSAAYHLARLGHSVTIREAAAQAGGMMRYGIPKYRLPREVLDAEIQRILQLGVTLELDADVSDLDEILDAETFDAVFLAVGAQIGRRSYIPAGSATHMLDAVTMLHAFEEGERPELGRRVAVYGGGNTALDVARTAARLGAEESIVIYRRTRDRMPAHDSEVREAEDEGIVFRWLTTIRQADPTRLTVERMELDDQGFPRPTGELDELDADSLVLALGQDSDLGLADGVSGVEVEDGLVVVDEQLMTGRPGVFAGGDVLPAERSATVAIGHGRRAALGIDDYLAGREAALAPQVELAEFSMLNTWYYSDAPRTHRASLEHIRRQSTFDEVVQGLDAGNALFEARRCLSCGNCFSCDNCYSVCPDNAVIKTGDSGTPYAIDLDFCKGCGLCAAECPAGAIRMVAEDV